MKGKENIFNILPFLIDLQLSLLQVLNSVGFPWQSSPPWAGAGEEQLRSLSSVPPPQLFEHWDQSLQPPQDPITGPKHKKKADVMKSYWSNCLIYFVESIGKLFDA